jgi:hypothetical protein
MIDGVFAQRFDSTGAKEYEIADWDLDGRFVSSDGSQIMFATEGTATGEVTCSKSGRYGIGIRARGTPCRGIYPIAGISVDGKQLGSIALDGDQWQDKGVFADLQEGQHQITVSFDNDEADPSGEDRNLQVDQLLVVAVGGQVQDNIFLTKPPAVAAQRRGSGLAVFDHIRWDTEQSNSRKASRYACSMLTALGADFWPKSMVTLECERMTPQPQLPNYSTDGSTAYLGSNGSIAATIEVAETNRYVAELFAAGDSSEGICPLVEVRIGDRILAQIQLTTEAWRSYRVDLDLPQGRHELSLRFTNDHYAPSGDRNLRLDKLVIHNDAANIAGN